MAKLIGTAGHVDHGKTSLIRALTGIDADRLPEEKARGMTIDIGFAYVDLPPHGRVSIVDVPGHERFLANLLVGALGVDVALLCVAADEGVMPQTREHLEVLQLLPVQALIVALTRRDLVDDETLALAAAEVQETVAAGRFGSVPVIPVSSLDGDGIPELREALTKALAQVGDTARGKGLWYLPVDRVFSVHGHGCVVTGTLMRGGVAAGDSAILQPGNREVRVRSIHSHEESQLEGEPGRRTALNLHGVRVEEVRRGIMVGAPGGIFETTVSDARVRWLMVPRHGARVRVSLGADEVMAKVLLSASEEGFAQLRFERPVACALDQPFIVRRYSPPELLGGGEIAVPQATARRRSEIQAPPSASSAEEAIVSLADAQPEGIATEEICRRLGRSAQELGEVIEGLRREGSLVGFGGLWFSREGWGAAAERLVQALTPLHEQNPLLPALPREKVLKAAGLSWSGKPLERILAHLAAEGRIELQGSQLKHPDFRVRLSPRQREFLDRVRALLEVEAINTPSVAELAQRLPAPPQAVTEIVRLGVQAGELVHLEEVLFTRGQVEGLKARLREFAGERPFTAAEFRDALQTTRKYAIPLLEHFDAIRFTTRTGDQRRINRER